MDSYLLRKEKEEEKERRRELEEEESENEARLQVLDRRSKNGVPRGARSMASVEVACARPPSTG